MAILEDLMLNFGGRTLPETNPASFCRCSLYTFGKTSPRLLKGGSKSPALGLTVDNAYHIIMYIRGHFWGPVSRENREGA